MKLSLFKEEVSIWFDEAPEAGCAASLGSVSTSPSAGDGLGASPPQLEMGLYLPRCVRAAEAERRPSPAKYFGDIDWPLRSSRPIASGRFEDDIRRMRMAAWHGADIMVIRHMGQSHIVA